MSDGTLFSIPAHLAFAPALARHVLDEYGTDPSALSRLTLLLPTRRSVLAMRQAFLGAAPGQALMLPAMAAIGDVGEGDGADELAPSGALAAIPMGELPAIGSLDRLTLLTRLVHKRLSDGAPLDARPPLEQAALLAGELARLIDRVQTAGLDFSALSKLMPQDRNLARHWEQSLAFLEIVTSAWPKILADNGLQDAAQRRHRLMLALAGSWQAEPPHGPIIAAGSTGSIPATRALLAIVAGLPRGRVVLPGLDLAADDAQWDAIGQDATHPQFGMAELLAEMGIGRAAVREIGGEEPPPRQRLLSLAMRPASVSEVWADGTEGLEKAARSVTRIDCDHAGEEAAVVALILRESLERPEGTAALVTPDRNLARRTVALLRRWGIDIDDSAGADLAGTPVGGFLRILSKVALSPDDPVLLLSLLKHPLARAGLSAPQFGNGVREFDLALRKDVSGQSWRELMRMAGPWAQAVTACLQPLLSQADALAAPLADQLSCHIMVAEALAATDGEEGGARLWAGEDGEAAASFIDELGRALPSLPAADFANYAGLFETLMSGHAVRSRRPAHPRLALLGPLEARLQAPDRVVLAGLNEGTWPRDAAPDPWMSYDMQRDFGLPAPERVVGLAAHDFVQSFASRQVFLTRARRVDGITTQPSRFLQRLATAMDGAGLKFDDGADGVWLSLARQLDSVPAGGTAAGRPPAPNPPVVARPTVLSQSAVGQLLRDPYAFYAQRILKLRRLDPVSRAPEARDRGEVLHHVLAQVLRSLDRRPDDGEAAERLRHAVDAELEKLGEHPSVQTFWRRRLSRAIDWLVAHEAGRDEAWRWAKLEETFEGHVTAGGRDYKLTAKADRVDLHPALGFAVIDYKTGAVPSDKDVNDGIEPQLPMEALLIAGGQVAGLQGPPPSSLEYWKLSGGRVPGETSCFENAEQHVEAAQEGLARLLAWLSAEETVFLSRVRPKDQNREGDFDHLARVGEWSPSDWEPSDGGAAE